MKVNLPGHFDDASEGPKLRIHRDNGCELHNSCLGCPEPTCALDLRGGAPRVKRTQRNANIIEDRKSGVSLGEVAKKYNLSPETIKHMHSGLKVGRKRKTK